MLAAQKAKPTTRVDLFLVERTLSDFRRLDEVANEYRARGVNIQTRRSDMCSRQTGGEPTDSLIGALARRT